jgi:hypothetical protein
MTLRRSLYARPGSSDDSGAPLVRHPANGVRGVRAQMRRRPERPYSKRIVQNRPFLRQLRTSASTTDQLSRNPGTLDLASAALDELKGQTTRRQARLEVASAGDTPLLKTYNSVWQTFWQTWLAALDHATGWVLDPA